MDALAVLRITTVSRTQDAVVTVGDRLAASCQRFVNAGKRLNITRVTRARVSIAALSLTGATARDRCVFAFSVIETRVDCAGIGIIAFSG